MSVKLSIIQHLAAYTVLWKCRCGGLEKSREWSL